MHYYLFLIISTILTITFLFFFASAFGQLEIPSEFSTFTNEEYDIEVEYPSGWQIFGDRVPGDYVTDIAVFAPSSEVNFKEYDSYKDFKKFNMRVLVFLDYNFIIPKLKLNFALDNAISVNSDTQSEATSGFKKFEIIESNTNSKLDGKKAYELIFQTKKKGDTFKYFTLATIINDNQVLGINFKAPLEEFDLLLPTFQRMIDSFKIGSLTTNTTNNNNSINEYSSNFNELSIEEIFGKDDDNS
jgi:hypothetical protein